MDDEWRKWRKKHRNKHLKLIKNMKTNWLKITAAVVAMGVATSAYAIPTVYVSSTGLAGSYTAVGSSASGVVQYNGTSGVWNLVVTTGTTAPALGSASNPIMDLSIQATTLSSTGGNLWIAFAANGFSGVGSLAALLTGHIVSGAAETLGYVTFGDASNTQPTTTLPTGSVITSLSGALGTTLSGSGAYPATTPYTLGMIVSLSTAGPSSASIDASFTSVPDGGMTAMLLGAGLTGLFMMRKKMVA
jgi:hypothetical protein